MSLPVKLSDIKLETIISTYDSSQSSMLPGEIPGANVINHSLCVGDKKVFNGQREFIRIFFICDGSVSFSSQNKTYTYNEKALFVNKPEETVYVEACTNATLLEMTWDLNEHDLIDIDADQENFPITLAYKDAEQYRDFFKSETTISRALIKQSIIPRFALGSVEAYGDDLVGQHAHPLLDQFFFSFPENDMDILIDCRICSMKGNTLLHIPLGSNHGVIAKGKQRMHYLWIDYTPQEQKDAAVAYLDEVHKPIAKTYTK